MNYFIAPITREMFGKVNQIYLSTDLDNNKDGKNIRKKENGFTLLCKKRELNKKNQKKRRREK